MNKETQFSDIEKAYRMKECQDYIDVGSFDKDLKRVKNSFSLDKNGASGRNLFSNQKSNSKLGTLIGRDMFFDVISDEKFIKKTESLNDIFISVENKEKENEKTKKLNFECFSVYVCEDKIWIGK